MIVCQTCGAEAKRSATDTAPECGRCFRTRLSSVSNGFTPSRDTGQIDPAKSRAWDARLGRYKTLRENGIQPSSTRSEAIEHADRVSQQTGEAFTARREDA